MTNNQNTKKQFYNETEMFKYPLLEVAFEKLIISYGSLLIMCEREMECIIMLRKNLTSLKLLKFDSAQAKVYLMLISLEIKYKGLKH